MSTARVDPTPPESSPEPIAEAPGPAAFDQGAEVLEMLKGASRPGGQAPQLPPEAPLPTERRKRGRPRKEGGRRKQKEVRRAAGKKAAETKRANQQAPAPGAAPGSEHDRASADAKRLQDAMGYNAIVFGFSVMLLGSDMIPSPDERAHCDAALAEYLRLHPDWKPRPELLLAVAYLGYLAPRVDQPTVKDRLSRIYLRVRDWVGGLKSKFGKGEAA